MTDPAGQAPTSNRPDIPWDQLSIDQPVVALDEAPASPVDDEYFQDEPSMWLRMAAGWADLVLVGIMTTAVLLGVLSGGYGVRVAAFPWAAGVAVLWWILSAVLCVRIRRGTPGMLVAGLMFSNEVSGYRIARTVFAAAVIGLLLGVPALPGGRDRSLISLASGSPLTSL